MTPTQKSSKHSLLTTLGLAALLALPACLEQPEDFEEFEDAFGDDMDQFRGCDSLRGGVDVCQNGTSIEIRGNNDRNEMIVTSYFDHDEGKTWIAIQIKDDGSYCYANCMWESSKLNMHEAHINDANLWYWQYFVVKVHLEQGGDEFEGRTGVIRNNSTDYLQFIDAQVWGQGGGDDIRFATIVDGGDGDDLIVGTNRGDSLKGGEKQDVIYGCAGNDDIWGQRGSDKLLGGPGNDDIDGGKSDDKCDEGSGNDDTTSCDNGPIEQPNWAIWQDDIFH